jgi:hypothetical protein
MSSERRVAPTAMIVLLSIQVMNGQLPRTFS